MAQRYLHGRDEISVGTDELTAENVAKVLSDCYVKHLKNRDEIEYLWQYYKGKQPILGRVKEIRPEIKNMVVENRANAIVTFRVGYTVGKPVQYVSAVSDDVVSGQIAKLNDIMRIAGKGRKDKELVEWMMIGGTGYRIVLPAADKHSKVPFDLFTLDPRSTFVIYRNDIGHTPLAGVYYTVDDKQEATFHVYADNGMYFKLVGSNPINLVESKTYTLKDIPIVEYPLNRARLGSFEVCLPLLDELNNLDSNRMDSVEQFVQSLLVAINCDFDEDVTANKIRQAGMISLPSIGENKADIKVISETLNQDQTQTQKQDIIDSINEIAGIPSQSNGRYSDSSNNGAVILRSGWQGAETRAQDFEQMFSEPEHRTLALVAEICNTCNADLKIDPTTVEPKFTRRNYEDLLSKSQTLVTMLNNDKIHPQCAYEACGLFVDTQDAYNMGMDWYEEHGQDNQEQPEEAEGDEALADRRHYVRGYWKD